MRVMLKSGKILDLTDIDPALLDIDVIAHHLSQIGRWCGATPQFYSVAEHCILVSETVQDKFAKAALLHDAHEAVIGDIIRPVQEMMDSTDIRFLKRRLNIAVGKRYYIHYMELESEEVTKSDDMWLNIEGSLFFNTWPRVEHIDYKKYFPRIRFLSPKKAKKYFLSRFDHVQRLHV